MIDLGEGIGGLSSRMKGKLYITDFTILCIFYFLFADNSRVIVISVSTSVGVLTVLIVTAIIVVSLVCYYHKGT